MSSSGAKSKKGAIFSDVDGTLCFHEQIHGIERIRKHVDGTVTVRAPGSGTLHRAYDVSVGAASVYMAVETRSLCHRLREQYDVILVTAARPSTVRARKEFFDFADGFILESGGVIWHSDFTADDAWYEHLQTERHLLDGVAESLRRQRWHLDDRGRTSAIRIVQEDNPQKTVEAFCELREHLELPSRLGKTINLGCLDIILRGAGKENAVRYMMKKRGYRRADTITIGDDINDLGFLGIGEQPFVLSSSYPEVLVEAQRRGWYISEGAHFEAINEILVKILACGISSQDD